MEKQQEQFTQRWNELDYKMRVIESGNIESKLDKVYIH